MEVMILRKSMLTEKACFRPFKVYIMTLRGSFFQWRINLKLSRYPWQERGTHRPGWIYGDGIRCSNALSSDGSKTKSSTNAPIAMIKISMNSFYHLLSAWQTQAQKIWLLDSQCFDSPGHLA